MLKNVMGLMGAGKGIYTVIKTIEELQDTDRHIITNFAFRVDPWLRSVGKNKTRGEKGFQAHLMDTCLKDYGVKGRIHIIPDEEMAAFYMWRINYAGELIKIKGNYNQQGALISFDQATFAETQPCCYIVDEAQRFWNSRDWQKTAPALSFYITQHRKAGDDVWVCCQHTSQLDKQMRVLFQEFHTLVNHKFRKMFLFKQPPMISVIVSNEAPELRAKGIASMPKIIKFDPAGVGSCYDTASGVGVQGRAADILQKPKGLPWWGMIVLVVGVGLLLIGAANGFGWLTGTLLTGGLTKKKEKVTPPVTSGADLSIGERYLNSMRPQGKPQESSLRPIVETPVEKVWMTGFAYMRNVNFARPDKRPLIEYKIILSSGKVYSTLDKRVKFLDEERCVIGTNVYEMATGPIKKDEQWKNSSRSFGTLPQSSVQPY